MVEASLDWWPDWTAQTVVLVASGPSARDADLEIAKGKAKFIAINNSWRLAPWADMLYACDHQWWNHSDDWKNFGGVLVSIDIRACREFGINHVACRRVSDQIDLSTKREIGWGGSSGFGALNLAVKFGAKRILLVGFDMTLTYGFHWHGEHPESLHNPSKNNIMRWRRAIDNAASTIADLGIEVVNCSTISTLANFPKMSFERAMECS